MDYTRKKERDIHFAEFILNALKDFVKNVTSFRMSLHSECHFFLINKILNVGTEAVRTEALDTTDHFM
jgi:hypothetical protein